MNIETSKELNHLKELFDNVQNEDELTWYLLTGKDIVTVIEEQIS